MVMELNSDDRKAFFFFLSQILHILPLTLQRLQRQLDFGEFENLKWSISELAGAGTGMGEVLEGNHGEKKNTV